MIRVRHSFLVLALLLLAATAVVHASQDIVIYNQGFAAVRETSSLTLSSGQTTASFAVPSGLIPDSLWLEFSDGAIPVTYQVVPATDLLIAALGREVEVVDTNAQLYRGTLISASNGLVIQEPDGRVVILKEYVRVRSSSPLTFSLDPHVDVTLGSAATGTVPITMVYLANGLSWQADYVAQLSHDETSLSLNAAVTISNSLGGDLTAANVSLVAGDLNVAETSTYAARSSAAPMAYDLNLSQAQAASEYYRYSLSQPLTLADGDSVTLPYAASSAVAVTKTYRYDGTYGEGVEIALGFTNSADEGLGSALPTGTIRVYSAQQDDFLFLGSDTLPPLSADESVELTIGTAFDLSGDRVVLSRDQPTRDVYEETIQVTLHNYKTDPVTIVVTEHPSGTSWEVLTSTLPFDKIAANEIEFTVTVPASGSTDVTYTSQYEY